MEDHEITLLPVCLCPTLCARQLLGKHVPAEINTHATTEELLDAVFFVWSFVMSYPQHVV
jgi:hypothetical protein